MAFESTYAKCTRRNAHRVLRITAQHQPIDRLSSFNGCAVLHLRSWYWNRIVLEAFWNILVRILNYLGSHYVMKENECFLTNTIPYQSHWVGKMWGTRYTLFAACAELIPIVRWVVLNASSTIGYLSILSTPSSFFSTRGDMECFIQYSRTTTASPFSLNYIWG